VSNAEISHPGRPGYLETFSLRCEPFAETIDSRFFYAGSTLMQRLDLLTHLTQFGDSVVLVSGPPGSGKTTLLSRFIGQSNNQWRLCLIDAADDFSQFVNRLADALVSDAVTSEQELLKQWANRSDSSQLLVIMIDNAEKLDEPSLDRLCALLDQESADRIRIILFGIPEAQQRLRQAFERKTASGSTQQLEMPRLNEEETSSYLLYRLAVAGYSGESPFTATEIRAMCKAADGRPAGLNRLADQALLERQARTESKRIRPGIANRKGSALAWGLATVGALSIAVYLGWQRFYHPSNDAHHPLSQQVPLQELPLAIPEPAPLPTLAAGSRTSKIAAQAKPPVIENVAASVDIGGKEETRQTATADTPLPDRAAPSEVIPQPADSAVPASEEAEKAVPPTSPIEQPPASETAGLDTEKQKKSVTPAETSLQTAAGQDQAQEQLPHREPWLLEQPETYFSLQLVGSRKEASIAGYIRRHKLDERKTAYYRGQYQGAAWYVLMYGVYPTKKAALEGRDTLPARIRKEKPWPRSLESVHASIREGQ
jgi:DamX protein